MLGRGVDQVLPHSCDPRLHERWVRSARRYVELAEDTNGPIPAPVEFSYPWGDALAVLEEEEPDARIVNLETAVTTSDDRWRGKGIHYRTHPDNVGVLEAAGVDCCVLANNHAMDWGREGLHETLETLRGAGIGVAGAGVDRAEAAAAAAVEITPRPEARDEGREAAADEEDARGRTVAGRRVLVHAIGSTTAGIPRDWRATDRDSGVNLLEDLSEGTARKLAAGMREWRQEGDLVVASVHWGGNWGYRIPPPQRRFAHLLIEEGGADVVHGHSSHHPKGIEVHRGRPILYGCGDFLNDYEGISGHESYRGDLALMYLVTLEWLGPGSGPGDGRIRGEAERQPGASSGPRLHSLEMVPMRIRRFRLEHASPGEARWLADTLDRECRELGGGVELGGSGRLVLRWDHAA